MLQKQKKTWKDKESSRNREKNSRERFCKKSQKHKVFLDVHFRQHLEDGVVHVPGTKGRQLSRRGGRGDFWTERN